MSRRAVITGIGVIAPNGIGKDNFWNATKSGTSGIKKIEQFDTSDYPSKIGGEVADFNPTDYMEKRKSKMLSRFAQFILVATRMAINDSGLCIANIDPYRIGISIGNTLGGKEVEEYQRLQKSSSESIDPFSVPLVNNNYGVCVIATEFGIKGPNITLSTGCTSALNAIAYAAEQIEHNNADIIVTGGSETPIVPFVFDAFCATGNLSRRNGTPESMSRPFDKQRDGFVLAEGCGMLIVEELEHARARQAHVYAEIAGWGCTNDAFSLFRMEPTGKEAAKAMSIALKKANTLPHEIDYINAHGSSSHLSDKRETNAIKSVFGAFSHSVAVSSIKSMIGQPLGAAGSLQTIAAAMAIEHSCIPPTINYEEMDPECDLDYTPNNHRVQEVDASLINCFGLGGNNSSMVLRSCK
ncbi:MAG: beta-ketoacyl-[acyl-carrier-protein] synthase family protein [Endomicrobiales bacterium]|jgi:3-oxoacyl-[acyl-carrier-protein] synthase II